MGLFTGPLRQRARRHLEGFAILREEDANSLGVESAGAWQVRGNGTLGLTDDELLFAQWVPNRVVRIPRDEIVEVDRASSHLGKSIGQDLLRVVWTDRHGDRDSIAFLVRQLDRWEAELRP